MVDVNLLGLLYCTHAALPLISEGGGGHIVNVSSVAGRNARRRRRRLQLDQVRRHRLLGGAAPGGAALEHPGDLRRAGLRRDRAAGPQQEPDGRQQGVEKMREQIGDVLQAEDIADAIVYAVSQPPHVSINEVLVRPTPAGAEAHRCHCGHLSVITYSGVNAVAACHPHPQIEVGPRVRALREAMDLSLRDLAERSGVSAQMLSQVERGETSPTLAVAARIASGLELDAVAAAAPRRGRGGLGRPRRRAAARRRDRARPPLRGPDAAAARPARRGVAAHAARPARRPAAPATRRCTSPARARRRSSPTAA